MCDIPIRSISSKDAFSDDRVEHITPERAKLKIPELCRKHRLHVLWVRCDVVPSAEEILIPRRAPAQLFVEHQIVILENVLPHRIHITFY